jgi:CheY-like chemotaxis protein
MARVLVIEDVPICLELMAYLLRSYGHEVLQAHTGSAGLAVLGKTRVDIVTCDIRLPGMDGYEVVREIRARPELAGLRVVAVTAGALIEDRRRALDAGFDGYIPKPVDAQTFVADFEALLAPGTMAAVRRPMRIWSLKPVDAKDKNWAASSYAGEVLIRAETENVARWLATSAYGIATDGAAEPVKYVPWEYASLVSCAPVAPGSTLREDGERAIVGPERAIQAARPPRPEAASAIEHAVRTGT